MECCSLYSFFPRRSRDPLTSPTSNYAPIKPNRLAGLGKEVYASDEGEVEQRSAARYEETRRNNPEASKRTSRRAINARSIPRFMSTIGYRRLTILLGGACVGLIILCASLFWNHGLLTIRVAWATEQVKLFDEMRIQALASEPAAAAGYLEYVVGYYPSGSKQEMGSRLDRMVEQARTRASREIVAHLRTRTGEDLGDHPEAWIQKYAKR